MRPTTDLIYRRAGSIEEALELWATLPGARYMAGGTDLLPKARCVPGAVPAAVVDIKPIEALRGIRERPEGGLCIGAATSIAEVAADERVRRLYPALAECASRLGSFPLRHRATIGGNICNASPCADTAGALLALEAEVVVESSGDRRFLTMDSFFEGPGDTILRRGELVREFRLPAATAGGCCCYGRIGRRAAVDISTVGVLVVLLPEGSPRHRVALTSVAPVPLRVAEAEAELDRAGPAGAARAAEIARAACRPISDVRGTAEYRRHMVGVLLLRGARAVAASGVGEVRP